MHQSKYSRSLLKKSIIAFTAVSAPLLQAATYSNDGGGNWNDETIWNPDGIPVAGDSVFIRNDFTVTVTAAQAATLVNLGESNGSGSLILNSSLSSLTLSGNLAVMRSGNFNNITGALTMSNGSLSVATMNVGVAANSGTGTATLSGGTFAGNVVVGSSSVNVSNSLLSLGYFNVMGSTANISGSSFLSNVNGAVAFQFGSTGVSMLNYSSGTATFVDGSEFSIDGSLYAGLGGDFKLVDSTTLGWSVDSEDVTITGFNGFTTQLLTDNNEVVLRLTAVPETSAAAMVLVALPLVGLRRKRRFVIPA